MARRREHLSAYLRICISAGQQNHKKTRNNHQTSSENLGCLFLFSGIYFMDRIPFLPGFLRISFFPAFSGGIFHRNVVLERLQEFLFYFPLLQEFSAGISEGQEFLYLPRNPPDSGEFLFPPKATGSGQQLKKALCSVKYELKQTFLTSLPAANRT